MEKSKNSTKPEFLEGLVSDKPMRRKGAFPLLLSQQPIDKKAKHSIFDCLRFYHITYLTARKQRLNGSIGFYTTLMFMCYLGGWLKETDLKSFTSQFSSDVGLRLRSWGCKRGLVEIKHVKINSLFKYVVMYRATEKAMKLYYELCKELGVKKETYTPGGKTKPVDKIKSQQ